MVVTCVGKKDKNYEGPSINESIDNLISRGINDNVDELFKEWKEMLIQKMKTFFILPKARDVYMGGMWEASIDAYRSIECEKSLWIISCGFGLINGIDNICSYHTTFDPNAADRIYDRNYFTTLKKTYINRSWWEYLTKDNIIETKQPHSLHELVHQSKKDDVVMIVAGKNYYDAIYNDLSKIQKPKNPSELVLVGIKRVRGGFEPDIPDHLHHYIQSYNDGKKLQEFLKEKYGKCNNVQRHPKSAKFLIEQYNKTGKLKHTFP